MLAARGSTPPALARSLELLVRRMQPGVGR